MSTRGRFLVGDLLATAAAGALVATCTGVLIPAGWPHWTAMVVGMLAGMALSVPCWLAAGLCLGMIEPMLQIMLAAMLAGMAGGMATLRAGPSTVTGLSLLGLACGVATSLAVACADWVMRNRGAE